LDSILFGFAYIIGFYTHLLQIKSIGAELITTSGIALHITSYFCLRYIFNINLHYKISSKFVR